MDESQWVPFAFAMVQSRARLQASVNNATCEPMQMIIQGEGGSGKSWLIKHIVKDVHNVFCEHSATRRTSKRLLLLAHQGTAAFNIKGQTICSALELTSFSRNAFSNPYSPMTTQKGGATKLKRLQEQYKDVHLVIIDEFSVISCGMLYWIDQRMREIWPQHTHQSFGGRDVVFTDDSAQLDPVIPHALATPSSKISSPIQVLGREIWEGISIVCTLTSQNQGKADSKWFEALRRLRSKCPTQADVNLFNSRYCKASEIPTWAVEAKHIAYLDAKVAEANNHNLKSCSNQIINIRTKDSVKLKRLAKHRDVSPSSIEALLHDAESSSSDRDRVVGRRLKIAIGAPVSLTYNMEQRAGLCNGTNGIVYDLIFSDELELPIILIQISDEYMGPSFLPDVPNIVPVVPRKVSWGKKASNLTVFREGIPLRLAYALTVHKVQGLTCDKVVFHSFSIPSAAFAYVVLSRVRTREDIVLTAPVTLQQLQSSSDKRMAFTNEEKRIQQAVSSTIAKAELLISSMKLLALQHNRALAPR
ncbi:Potassium/sodium hyperpolarization-activated cyclic nucleotide-gated channel 1 [Phytophthora nicotianae]|uniref:ATP-dependent DNA helicase n=1 Tax=Phytophthora nicotianae TaxID=4792 RepID=A0A0W8CWC1_PHYNI|nr:Potassium/sodium hyperpolarization-activated cyclic nucleotide-gated channel 1 [Phytophthora nicotianae]